ncbi:MAG: acetamidase/formamidase family protein [Planctomycetales bacterium]|nr:acetamidase/formamidase family protein [Planctomycetales bacterium]
MSLPHVSAEPLIYEFRRDLEPRAVVRCGDRLTVESEDALSGQIRRPGDQRDKQAQPKSNPVAGPIYVEDVEPGDVLLVRIEEITPRDGQCATYTGHPRRLAEWLGDNQPPGGRVCPIRDGLIHWNERITIPYRPMLGCIGVAPAWGVPTTLPAGPYGGNLDLVEVRPGSVVHLPVTCPGGLLFLGDAHAAMGHGELSATGLEMAAITRIQIDCVKQRRLEHVRIETPDELAAVATGSPMEHSIAEAYARLILWMEQDFGWDRWQAYDLLTHVGTLSVGYYGIGTVAAKIEKRYLAPRPS